MKTRCPWCEDSFDDYVKYHDEEWGVPVHDDRTHFEFLILEGAQAGLSWSTILKKRDGYRNEFADFDVQKVARFEEQKIQQMLQNPGIIRNELKVRSAITNAQLFIDIQEEVGSFNDYIWSFVGGSPKQNSWSAMDDVQATTKESDALAADLQKRGFKFTGSTIMYAHMQATGLVNDHIIPCFRHKEVKEMS